MVHVTLKLLKLIYTRLGNKVYIPISYTLSTLRDRIKSEYLVSTHNKYIKRLAVG